MEVVISYGEDDYVPTGGYSSIMKHLFDKCKPELKLGHKVLNVDYSGEGVRVVTDKGTFSGKCVLASFPLGVLQSKSVSFIPDLPGIYRTTINNMGSGVANKIYASF